MDDRATGARSAVVGIDFGGTKVDIALATGIDVVLQRLRLDTLAEQGPEQVISRTGAAVAELVDRASTVHGVTVAGCAAVSPGAIQSDRVLLAPNLPGWDRLALHDRLREVLPVQLLAVENDVRAGAVAEVRAGALRGANPGVYLSLGTGIAAALAIDGRVVRGAHGAAGEIGYTVLDPFAALAALDGSAPLESLAGGKAIGERASRQAGSPVTAEDVFSRTDPVAEAIVHDATAALAMALGNLAVFIDPQRIVVGGGLGGSALARILPVLAARLRRVVPFPPDIVRAKFTTDASLHGALALALDALDALDAMDALDEHGPSRTAAPRPRGRCIGSAQDDRHAAPPPVPVLTVAEEPQ